MIKKFILTLLIILLIPLTIYAETLYPGYLANNADHKVLMKVYNNSKVEGNSWVGDNPVASILLEPGQHFLIYIPIGKFSLIMFDYKRNMWHSENFDFTQEKTGGDFVLQYDGHFDPYRFLDVLK